MGGRKAAASEVSGGMSGRVLGGVTLTSLYMKTVIGPHIGFLWAWTINRCGYLYGVRLRK
jgi:hypothetical protein